MHRKLLLPLLLFDLLSIQPAAAQHGEHRQPAVTKKESGFTVHLLPLPDGTWGYDILKSGRLMIHQPSIPGMPGNSGFKTQTQALKVAELVIRKIKQGMVPPTVTPEELKKLSGK